MPCVIADAMHHMLRVDFLMAMQLFCAKLKVPAVTFVEVCEWLRDGTVQSDSLLEGWLHAMDSPDFRVQDNPLDIREKLTPAEHCIYLATSDMRIHVPDNTDAGLVELDAYVACKLGSMLFNQNASELDQKCQIEQSATGEAVLHGMLFTCVNKQMRWPVVFGNIETYMDFWKGSAPANEYMRDTCSLAPMQVVRTDRTKAALVVDMRWLLLISATCGPSPSQASMSLFVSTWTQHFFRSCIPNHLLAGSTLVTGLASPWMQSGFLLPDLFVTERRFLRRPLGSSKLDKTAQVSTGAIEDYGASEQRCRLAGLLKVDVDSIIDDEAYCCSFATEIWYPVRLTSGSTTSLKFNREGRFMLAVPNVDGNGYIEQVLLLQLLLF